MAINLVVADGVLKSPALRYDRNSKPELRFTLHQTEKDWPLYLPCCAVGAAAERPASEIDDGQHIVVTSGKLCYRTCTTVRLYQFAALRDPEIRAAWARLLGRLRGQEDLTARAEPHTARDLLDLARQLVLASQQGRAATFRSLALARQRLQLSRQQLQRPSRADDRGRTPWETDVYGPP